MSLLNAWDVISYVKASAGRVGLNVVFEDQNQPRHDGKNIYLPRITVMTTKEQLEDMMASTDHEVSHDEHSDFDVLKAKKVNMKTLLGVTWNLLEDSRVNSLEADDYQGFRLIWDASSSRIFDKMLDEMKKTTNEKLDFLNSGFAWDATSNRERFPRTSAALSSLPINPKYVEAMTDLTRKFEEVRMIRDKEEGTKATYDLSLELLLACGFTEKQIKEENEELAKRMAEISVTKSHDEEFCAREESPLRKHVRDYGGDYYVSDVFAVSDFTHGPVHSFHGAMDLSDPKDKSWYIDFGRRMNAIRGKSTTCEGFSQQVRRLLQILSRVRYERGVKAGKLDQSRLARICVKDAPGFNERIFKKKIVNKLLDASITLLVDTSGSMSGKKYSHAVEAAMLMNDAIGNALHIPCEILGFTDRGTTPVMFIHKQFDKKASEEQLMSSFAKAAMFMSGNPDGENILWAYNRLVKRKERKKVLIVFSDGDPAGGKTADGLFEFTREVIEQINKERIVDIYGIGIMDGTVEDLYKHQCVINDANEISHKLLEVIEAKLLGDR